MEHKYIRIIFSENATLFFVVFCTLGCFTQLTRFGLIYFQTGDLSAAPIEGVKNILLGIGVLLRGTNVFDEALLGEGGVSKQFVNLCNIKSYCILLAIVFMTIFGAWAQVWTGKDLAIAFSEFVVVVSGLIGFLVLLSLAVKLCKLQFFS